MKYLLISALTLFSLNSMAEEYSKEKVLEEQEVSAEESIQDEQKLEEEQYNSNTDHSEEEDDYANDVEGTEERLENRKIQTVEESEEIIED